MEDLGKDFKTVSCDGFWAFLATPDGEDRAREWMRRLGDGFITACKNCFWSILTRPRDENTPSGEDIVKKWWKYFDHNFPKVAKSGFWSHVDDTEFVSRIESLITKHGKHKVARVIQAGSSHFGKGDYYNIVMKYLTHERFITFQNECGPRLVVLKEFIPRFIKGSYIQKQLRELCSNIHKDETTPVQETKWIQYMHK